MNLPKFEYLARTSRLFMPNAAAFGDQLEGSTPQGEIERRTRRIETAKTEEQRAIAQHNHDFFQRMPRKFKNLYFVSCWHMNRYESEVMWGAYTQPDNGIAVRVSYLELYDALPKFVLMGVVGYLDYDKDAFNAGGDPSNMFAWIMHKDIHYVAENEVRAVAVPPVNGGGGKSEFEAGLVSPIAKGGLHAYAPPLPIKKLVKEVIVRHGAPSDLVDKVAALCGEFGLPRPTISRRAREPKF